MFGLNLTSLSKRSRILLIGLSISKCLLMHDCLAREPELQLLSAIPNKALLDSADEKFLAVFEVEGNDFVAKVVRDEQAASLGLYGWQRIETLFPLEYRNELVQFNVLDGKRWAGFFSGDGSNDVDRKGYRLSIAKYLLLKEGNRHDPARCITPRRKTLDWTLVHEMGHYLCLRTDSIERFSQVFDGDAAPQPRRRQDPDDYAEDGSPKLVGNFVTSYAERNGGDEEVVECFTTYMLVPEIPSNDSLVAQKIRFFEGIEGMSELRAHIQQFQSSH
ncbi:hypothetical protein SAMN06265222_101552 [Neorhodopirellula lusitana]|uniref:Uncharacterized protein n=2 Tax=Neorhodopirellula lusitana TaxID=445327 RepID=A0ABY1PSU4_9BACT|nr:hypothetical protein SAMN06265222_101552 [Neorhodopirellula lusitana]